MSLAKLLFILFVPLGVLLILQLGVLSTLSKRRTAARLFVIASILIIWMGGMPVTSAWLAGVLEAENPVVKVVDAPVAEAIVVLGGGLAHRLETREISSLGEEINRAWFATRLFQEGKAPMILVTGGGVPPEAPLVGRVLQRWGIPNDKILLEDQSRTTRQNAAESWKLAKQHGINRIILVTTAIHMPRAAAAFRAVGFDVIPFPVNHKASSPNVISAWFHWLPNAEDLQATTERLMEAAARFYYRLKDWA